MDVQSNIGRGTGALQAIWDGENGNKLRAIFAPDFEFHNLNGTHEIMDLKGLRYRVAALRATHPGAHLRVENSVSSGSHIAFEWSLRDASSEGARSLRGQSTSSASGGSCMVRLRGDQVVELWELRGALAE